MPKTYINMLKIVGITLAVYLGMKYILPAVIPFLFAWILVKMVLPMSRWLQRKFRIKKVVSGIVILAALGGVLGTAVFFLGNGLITQICNLAANLDGYTVQAEEFVSDCCRVVERNTGIHARVVEDFVYDNLILLEERVRVYTPEVLKNSITYLMSMMKWLGVAAVVVISVIMLLKDYDKIKEKLEEYPSFLQIRRIVVSMQSLGGAWLKAQIIIIIIVTAVCVAGLWLLRYPYALLIGIVIGLLDALPFIGTGTILVPWALYLIFTRQIPYGVCLIVLFIGTNMLREYLEPKLIGDKIGVYPIVMVAAVYIGLYIYGISGVILGPVSYLLIAEIYKEVQEMENN